MIRPDPKDRWKIRRAIVVCLPWWKNLNDLQREGLGYDVEITRKYDEPFC